jgi:3-oxoacyl-(acyl-carrier-protein) synthase III
LNGKARQIDGVDVISKFAYIMYDNVANAQKAIQRFDGTTPFGGSKPISVESDLSRPDRCGIIKAPIDHVEFHRAETSVITGHLRMEGKEVFRHAIEKLAETAHAALDKAGLTPGDVDWIVPHQANIRIIEGTAKKMQVSMDKVIVTVQDHGNTSAASIPLALSVGKARGQLREGDLVVTEAIGGGLAWGSVVLRW